MNTRSKSSLFLIELIVVILIFAISSAACLRLFFQSRQIANESRNLSHASLAVQSAADCYKAEDGDMKKTADLIGGDLLDETVYLYYDSHWGLTEEEGDTAFSVTVMELSPGIGIVSARSMSGDPIFSVTVRGGLNLGL